MKEGWRLSKLGDISSFQSGNRPKGGVGALREGVLSLGGEHIGKDGHIKLETPKFVTQDFFNNNPKGHIENNDILLCKDGALTGKVAIVRNELVGHEAMINEHVFIVRSTLLLQKYLYYFLYSPVGQIMLKSRITGAAQGGLNGANLKTILVPYPTIIKQQEIVEELDLLSSIIEKKKAQLNELDNLAQSLFYEMFGDPITNEKGWIISKVKDLGKVITGNTPSRKIPQYYDSEYIEWIKTDNILKDSLYATRAKEYLSESGAVQGRTVDKGTLLVACIAGSLDSIGKVCITDRNVAFNQQINAIIPNTGIDILFLYYTIVLMGSYIREHATSGMKHIMTKSAMEALSFPIPPLTLQEQFAKKIKAIEHQKEFIKQSIKEVETLFNSRMDYYFN